MNNLKNLALFLSFFTGFLLFTTAITAQWDDADLHFLTDNPMDKALSNQSVDIDEKGQIHIIYQQNNGGIEELWYVIRSAEGVLGVPVQINDQQESVEQSAITVLNSEYIFISYLKEKNGNPTLFVRRFTADEEMEYQITDSSNPIYTPSITSDEMGVGHISWIEEDEEGEYRLFYGNTEFMDTEFQPDAYREMVPFTKVHPDWANPKIRIAPDSSVHIAYIGGPNGLAGLSAQYVMQISPGLWNYDIIPSSNDDDSLCIFAMNENEIHLVYSGSDAGSNTNKVAYTKRTYDGDWTAPIMLADEEEIMPHSIYSDTEGIVHLAMVKGGNEFRYGTNESGIWNIQDILGGYPIESANLILDNSGNGFLLAKHQTTEAEQIILWGSLITDVGFEILDESLVHLYPNPATNQITIEQLDDFESIQIVSVQGKIIYSGNIETLNNLQLNTEDWNRGVYFVLISKENKLLTKKIILN